MSHARWLPALCAALCLCLQTQPSSAAPPRIVSITYLGTAGDDRIDDVAFAPDGSLYLAGTFAARPALPHLLLGEADKASSYGVGFVAHLDADGATLRQLTCFAPGLTRPTSIIANSRGVYLAGYATGALAPLLAGSPGLHKTHTPAMPGPTVFPREHYDEPKTRPAADQRGQPFLLRFPADLATINSGTYLEGWQSIWHVPRPLNEDHIQPVCIAALSDGDVVVCHDGGYNTPPTTQPDKARDAISRAFYHQGDHLSRVSDDLAVRRWHTEFFSPPVDRQRAAVSLGHDWPFDAMGNTRTFRLRVDPRDNLYLCGWSASRTTKEPWWSPFLRKYDASGKHLWSAYEFDPTSGQDARLNNLVSDSFIRTVAIATDGSLLVSGIGDGGNSVLRQDPRDFTRRAANLRGSVSGFPGRVLFWGQVSRLDANSRELISGNHLNASAPFRGGGMKLSSVWANDLCELPDARILAVGRNNEGFEVSKDAWFTGRGSFLRLYTRDFDDLYTTSLPDTDLTTVAHRAGRCAIIGSTRFAKLPTSRPVQPATAGGADGCLLVLEFPRALIYASNSPRAVVTARPASSTRSPANSTQTVPPRRDA